MFTYESNRVKLIEEISKLSSGYESKWTQSIEYPDANTIISYSTIDSEKRPTERFTFDNSKLIKKESLGLGDDMWKANEEYNYSYSGDQLSEISVKHGNPITGELTLACIWSIQYENGRLQDRVIYNEYMEEYTEKLVYEYEGEQLSALVTYKYSENVWVPKRKVELVYVASEVSLAKFYDYYSEDWYHRGDMVFKYDQNGNCIELVSYNDTIRWTYENGLSNYQDLYILPQDEIENPYIYQDL